MTTQLAIVGVAGQMGRALLSIVSSDENLTLSGAHVRSGHAWEGQELGSILALPELHVSAYSELPSVFDGAMVVVDFSAPDLFSDALMVATNLGLPFVSGTTGLSEAHRAALELASQKIPIVYAANFSVGVCTLLALVQNAARVLGPEYETEILEIHHRRKKDSPSGTAIALGEAVAKVRGQGLSDIETHRGRGVTGPRESQDLGISALRGGDVVGEHTVFFFGEGERLELGHRATDRRIFARGAIRAAKWCVGKPAGLYGMNDVLGL